MIDSIYPPSDRQGIEYPINIINNVSSLKWDAC